MQLAGLEEEIVVRAKYECEFDQSMMLINDQVGRKSYCRSQLSFRVHP